MTGSPPSSVDLAVVVQHHPARAHLLDTLLPALGTFDVVTDPKPAGPPSAIRTYLACLEHVFCMREDATHGLIVQDDAVPCMQFACKAHAAITERPDVLVALFLAGAPVRSARLAQAAHRRGERWATLALGDWVPTVALAWPRPLAERFLAYVAANPDSVKVGDDNLVGAWARTDKIEVAVTVPSLVQHPDIEDSLIGRKASGGANRYRVAAVAPVATSDASV